MVGNIGMSLSGRDAFDSARLGDLKQRLFKKLDADGSGSVNAEELSAFKPPRMEGMGDVEAPDASQLIEDADSDGDQQLSEEEFLAARPPAGTSGVPFGLKLKRDAEGGSSSSLQSVVSAAVLSALRQYTDRTNDSAEGLESLLGLGQRA